jgi:hypothetical protein
MARTRKVPKTPRREPDESGGASEVGRPTPAPRYTKRATEAQEMWAGPIDRQLAPPRWLRGLIAKNSPPDEILTTLVQRLRKGTTSARDALDIANEFGRRPDGGALISKHLTQKLVDEISKGGANR